MVEVSIPDDIPTQCVSCDSEICRSCPAVIQQCLCLVALCHGCALRQLISRPETYRSFVECPVCCGRTHSDSGTFLNVKQVEEREWALVLRAFEAFRLTKPSSSRRNAAQFAQLLQRFKELPRFAAHVIQLQSNSVGSGEEADLAVQRLLIARMEWARGGPLAATTTHTTITTTSSSSSANNANANVEIVIDCDEDEEDDAETEGEAETEDGLPLGPLRFLGFARNASLERLLLLDRGDAEELALYCNVCGETLKQGSSVLSSCSCNLVFCVDCAVRSTLFLKETYCEGLRCPLCRVHSRISFRNIEEVQEKENAAFLAAYELFEAQVDPAEANNGSSKKASRKSSQSRQQWLANVSRKKRVAKALIECFFVHGAPPNYSLDLEILKTMPQLSLEVARLHDYFTRHALSHTHTDANTHKDREGEAMPLGPLQDLQCVPNAFLELYLRHTRCDGAEEDLDLSEIDWSLYTFNPLNPLNTPNPGLNPNPPRMTEFVQTSTHTYTDTDTEAEENDIRRFVPFKRVNTLDCVVPGCACRFYSPIMLQRHLSSVHRITPRPSITPAEEHAAPLDSTSLPVIRKAAMVDLSNDQEQEEVPLSVVVSDSAKHTKAEPVPIVIEQTHVEPVGKDLPSTNEEQESKELISSAMTEPDRETVESVLAKEEPLPSHVPLAQPQSETDREKQFAIEAKTAEESEEETGEPDDGKEEGEEEEDDDSPFSAIPKLSKSTSSSSSGVLPNGLSQFQLFENVRLSEPYEMIFTLPTQKRESVHCSDPGKFDGFRLVLNLRLHPHDLDRLRAKGRAAQEEYRGVINVYTNKRQLSTVRVALKAQTGFEGSIVRFRTPEGRPLQTTRSLSYYHIQDGSTLTIQPLQLLDKERERRRPIMFFRRNVSRLTHVQIALRHAEQQKKEKEQREREEREKVQKMSPSQKQNTAPTVPTLTGYERALLEDDDDSDDSEVERKRKAPKKPNKPPHSALIVPRMPVVDCWSADTQTHTSHHSQSHSHLRPHNGREERSHSASTGRGPESDSSDSERRSNRPHKPHQHHQHHQHHHHTAKQSHAHHSHIHSHHPHSHAQSLHKHTQHERHRDRKRSRSRSREREKHKEREKERDFRSQDAPRGREGSRDRADWRVDRRGERERDGESRDRPHSHWNSRTGGGSHR